MIHHPGDINVCSKFHLQSINELLRCQTDVAVYRAKPLFFFWRNQQNNSNVKSSRSPECILLFVQCFIHTGWLSFDYQYSPHTHPSMNHLSQSLSFSLSLVCVSLHFICLLCFRGLRSAVCLSAHFKHLLWLCFVCDKSDHQASLLPIDIPSTSDTRRLASIRQNMTGRWQHINIYFIYI